MKLTTAFALLFTVTIVVTGQDETDEDDGRKLFAPHLVKPIIALALLKPHIKPIIGGIKPAVGGMIGGMGHIQKPGLEIEVITHQAAQPQHPETIFVGEVDHNVVIHHPAPAPPPIHHPVPVPLPIPTPPVVVPPPPHPTCGSLNGFTCYSVSSGGLSSCYCLISTQLKWVDALNYCSNNGKKLISIQTPAKMTQIKTFLPALIGTNNIFTKVGYWTSGTFMAQLSSFIWASIPEYFSASAGWYVGEPHNQALLKCGDCVRSAPTVGYGLDDLDCFQYLPFICES